MWRVEGRHPVQNAELEWEKSRHTDMTGLILRKHLFLGHGEREGVRYVVVSDPFHVYNPFWDVASVH